jgi:hypothetical protein
MLVIKMSMKRLNLELANRNYEILEYSEDHSYFLAKIIRIWKNKNDYSQYIDFNVKDYPFKRPFIIGSNLFNINHDLYKDAIQLFKLNDYVSHVTHKKTLDFCIFCNSILSCHFDWTPRYMLYHIIKQLNQINGLLSSAIKLNVLKRNSNIPEDLFPHIFSFLTPNLDYILDIKFDQQRLKIL